MENINISSKLLQNINELLELYNELPGVEKKALVSEKYIKSTNLPTIEKPKDISEYWVCLYNDDKVGLFKEVCHSSKVEYVMGIPNYSAGSIFFGIDSDLVGMKTTHLGFSDEEVWDKIGKTKIIDQKKYQSNCNMQDAMMFNDVRLIMYDQGLIPTYKIGKATDKEIIEVLNFARNYYNDKIVISPQKKK